MSRVWTISKLHLWEECGLKYALEHEPAKVIGRFKGWALTSLPGRTESPAMLRGSRIHDLFERFVKDPSNTLGGEIDDLKVLDRWVPYLDSLRTTIFNAGAGGTEVLWAYDDGWYVWERGSNAPLWHRQKLDAWWVNETEAEAIDYKTGRYYPKHRDQMEVYALGVFARFDDVGRVNTVLAYLDGNDTDPFVRKEFDREKDAPRLARKWESRAQKFIDDTAFRARPGRYCDWCPYNQTKGGPCPAGKQR